MEEHQADAWVLDYVNTPFLKSQAESIFNNQYILQITNTLTIKKLFINQTVVKMAFPTLDTVVVLQDSFENEKEDPNTSYILHINLRTNKQRVFRFRHRIQIFQVSKQDEIIFINYSKVSLDAYSLTHNILTKRVYLKPGVSPLNSKLYFFQETQYACIVDAVQETISEIAFYDFRKDCKSTLPICSTTAPVPQAKVFKLNRHSMIGWPIGMLQKDKLRIQTFVGSEKTMNSHLSYTFCLEDILPEVQLKKNEFLWINKIEEVRQHVFWMKVEVSSEVKKEKPKDVVPNPWVSSPPKFELPQQVRSIFATRNNNNSNVGLNRKNEYILKADGATGKVALFHPIPPLSRNIIYKVVNFMPVGQYTYFVVQDTINVLGNIVLKLLQTVDNRTNMVISSQQKQKKSQLNGFVFCGLGLPRVSSYDDWDNPTEITITTKIPFQYKTMYIHELLTINEDFDDDLLKDCLDLLQLGDRQQENLSEEQQGEQPAQELNKEGTQ